MPIALSNALATFQRLMKNIYGTLIRCGVRVYLDDVVIYAKTSEERFDKQS